MDIPPQFIGWGTRALEVVVGVIFIVHGWAKFRSPKGMGALLGGGRKSGLLFAVVEMVAGAVIATSFSTFYGAFVAVVIMLGALYFHVFKWKTKFTTNTNGWELELLLLAAALVLLIG